MQNVFKGSHLIMGFWGVIAIADYLGFSKGEMATEACILFAALAICVSVERYGKDSSK